jgi:hypothetical protein
MRCLEGTSVGLRERQTSANLTLRQLSGNGALGDAVPGAERLPAVERTSSESVATHGRGARLIKDASTSSEQRHG